MKIHEKDLFYFHIFFFHVFNYDFIIYIYFRHIADPRTLIDDVTSQVTHRIFSTNL